MENTHYQYRVWAWVLECFGWKIGSDKTERSHRFIEESLELVHIIRSPPVPPSAFGGLSLST